MPNRDSPEFTPLPARLQIIASIISEGKAADLGERAVQSLNEAAELLRGPLPGKSETVVLQGWDEGLTVEEALNQHDRSIARLEERVSDLEAGSAQIDGEAIMDAIRKAIQRSDTFPESLARRPAAR